MVRGHTRAQGDQRRFGSLTSRADSFRSLAVGPALTQESNR